MPEMPSNPIRVAVWGLGNHAIKNVIPAIEGSHVTKLAGIVTRNTERASAVAQALSVEYWPCYKDMLASRAVDAVYLSTPIALHYEQGMAVLKAGKHLLCEKSLTNDRGLSFDLLNFGQSQGLVVLETFMYRFHPQWEKVESLLSDIHFGKIVSMECHFGMPHLDQPGFRTDPALGGGAFWDVGCYPISALNHIQKELPADCLVDFAYSDDYLDQSGTAYLQYRSGTKAYLTWGFGRSYRNELSVCGENRQIYVDRVFSKKEDVQTAIRMRDLRGNESLLKTGSANAFVLMFEAFVRAMHQEEARIHITKESTLQAELMHRIKKCA